MLIYKLIFNKSIFVQYFIFADSQFYDPSDYNDLFESSRFINNAIKNDKITTEKGIISTKTDAKLVL